MCSTHFSYFFVSCTWFSGLALSITITHVFTFSKCMSIKHCFSILSDLSYIELVCSTFVLFPVTVPNLYFHFGTVGQSCLSLPVLFCYSNGVASSSPGVTFECSNLSVGGWQAMRGQPCGMDARLTLLSWLGLSSDPYWTHILCRRTMGS